MSSYFIYPVADTYKLWTKYKKNYLKDLRINKSWHIPESNRNLEKGTSNRVNFLSIWTLALASSVVFKPLIENLQSFWPEEPKHRAHGNRNIKKWDMRKERTRGRRGHILCIHSSRSLADPWTTCASKTTNCSALFRRLNRFEMKPNRHNLKLDFNQVVS